MTQGHHDKLEAMRPEAKDAYIAAKARILDAIRDMDLLTDTMLSEEEKKTVMELLNDTSFLMQSEEL